TWFQHLPAPFLSVALRRPRPTLFPYTTLFRSEAFTEPEGIKDGFGPRFNLDSCGGCHQQPAVGGSSPSVNPQVALATQGGARNRDRKSTRLNSSHVSISYAVFCLKKKNLLIVY